MGLSGLTKIASNILIGPFASHFENIKNTIKLSLVCTVCKRTQPEITKFASLSCVRQRLSNASFC